MKKRRISTIKELTDIEKSLNSLVFTSGGMAPEFAKVNKRLAEEIYSWKTQGALCIWHDLHTFKEHPCNIRLWGKQWCSPTVGTHRHRLQSNSSAHNSVKLNCRQLFQCHDSNIRCVVGGYICHSNVNKMLSFLELYIQGFFKAL